MSLALFSLNYHKCRPDQCNNGYCIASNSCPLQIIVQEEKFGFPYANPSLCKGCAKCSSACPLNAISIIK